MFDMKDIFKDLDSSFRALCCVLIASGVVVACCLVALGAWLF